MSTEYLTVRTVAIIHPIHTSEKTEIPYRFFLRIPIPHSYVLLISVLIAIYVCETLLWDFKECINSWVTIILSEVIRPGMKAACESETILSRNHLTGETSKLEIILYKT